MIHMCEVCCREFETEDDAQWTCSEFCAKRDNDFHSDMYHLMGRRRRELTELLDEVRRLLPEAHVTVEEVAAWLLAYEEMEEDG